MELEEQQVEAGPMGHAQQAQLQDEPAVEAIALYLEQKDPYLHLTMVRWKIKDQKLKIKYLLFAILFFISWCPTANRTLGEFTSLNFSHFPIVGYPSATSTNNPVANLAILIYLHILNT
jgi:hypothetical protein